MQNSGLELQIRQLIELMDIQEGDLITDMVMVTRGMNSDQQLTVYLASTDGVDEIVQLGMLRYGVLAVEGILKEQSD